MALPWIYLLIIINHFHTGRNHNHAQRFLPFKPSINLIMRGIPSLGCWIITFVLTFFAWQNQQSVLLWLSACESGTESGTCGGIGIRAWFRFMSILLGCGFKSRQVHEDRSDSYESLLFFHASPHFPLIIFCLFKYHFSFKKCPLMPVCVLLYRIDS